MVLEAIKYSNGKLQVLDQLQLPYVTHFDEIDGVKDGWQAIKAMRVRGAPAIAIVAILSLAVEVRKSPQNEFTDSGALQSFIEDKLAYLVTSRPTAVNLRDAAEKLKQVTRQAAASTSGRAGSDVRDAFVNAAERMLDEDVATNKALAKHGADWILQHAGAKAKSPSPVSVVTICNTGSLATAGYGTALGVIRQLHATNALRHAYHLETRPYNQGSRLTAFELLHDKIPSVLITDSMAGALFARKATAESIAAVLVGADRVVRSGATANKIGTYSLAILARYHGIKFLVAAPRTSIDLATENGDDIVIEERPGKEMTCVSGAVVRSKESGLEPEVDPDQVATVATAAPGISVWNPAFDVTPPELIDGIVTEVGVFEKDAYGKFHLETCHDVGKA